MDDRRLGPRPHDGRRLAQPAPAALVARPGQLPWQRRLRSKPRLGSGALGLLLGLSIIGCGSRAAAATPAAKPTRPNIVVLMTDDQTVDDLRVMPRARALLGDRGVTFDRFFATYPVCAPSRATFLSGQYAHNNRVMGLAPPDGGFGRFDGGHALPNWLAAAGYRTVHIGKYINGYGSDAGDAAPPPGWSEWHGLLGPSTYRMWGYTLNEDGANHTFGTPAGGTAGQYQTNVLGRLAVGVIRRHAISSRPLFLSVAFVAPHHEQASIVRKTGRLIRPAPADTRWRLKPALRRADFNERDVSDKPPPQRRRARLGPAQVRQINAHTRDRQASLQAVDRAVAAIVAELRRSGQLDRTYILLTSDNGFMSGQHRIAHGKMVPYDPSTRVPLLIRGPGLPAGGRSRALTANIDLAPTILALTGAHADRHQDGISLVPLARHPTHRTTRPLLLEAGGRHYASRARALNGVLATRRVLTYQAVRTNRWLYVRYQDGERELYDIAHDPLELRSRDDDPRYARTERALDALARRLSTCQGSACTDSAPPIPAPRPRRRADRRFPSPRRAGPAAA